MASDAEAQALADSYLGNNDTTEIARYLATKLVRGTATKEVVAEALVRIVATNSSAADNQEVIVADIRRQVEMMAEANTEVIGSSKRPTADNGVPVPGAQSGNQDTLMHLLQQLLRNQQSATTPTPVTPVAQVSQIPRRLTKDPKWDGKRENYQMFKYQIGQVFDRDAACFPTDESKKSHLLACVEEPTAQANIFTWIRGHTATPFTELLEYMDNQYSDKLEKEKAMQELTRIRQRSNEAFNTYATRFNQLAITAGDNLPESMKIAIFEQGLRDELKPALTILTPSAYGTFSEYQREALAKLERQENMKRRQFPSAATQERYSARPELTMGGNDAGTMMDTSGMNVRTSGRSSPLAGDRNKRRAKWVTKEELGRRRANGWCVRCGSSSHFRRACPYAPAQHPQETPALTVNARIENEPEIEDEATEGKSVAPARSREQEQLPVANGSDLRHDSKALKRRARLREWTTFRTQFNSCAFTVSTIVNDVSVAYTMIDNGCLCYGMVSPKYANKHQLERFTTTERAVSGVGGKAGTVSEVARLNIDINGHKETIWLYVFDTHTDYDLILGRPWMNKNDVTIATKKNTMYIHVSRTRVKSTEGRSPHNRHDIGLVLLDAPAFSMHIRQAASPENKKKPEGERTHVFTATMADIDKALRGKTRIDPRTVLPDDPEYLKRLHIFDEVAANELPPHRGPGVDLTINLEKDENGKEREVPWGPLYNMTKEELLVLRQELTKLLDKGFIRVSKSPAGAPVLFAKKPGGGLRLCIDYRALNAITRKDRYPIPLIQETLRKIADARWFTKLDVKAAFNKIRIAEGDEWKTAIRTRYGLYEWLVTPFGPVNAPSTFQRYINYALRDYLDEFCSAYIDDILIFSSGSRSDHRKKVLKVLDKLTEAGLYLDISKCEFECTSTKYLGYIIEAGRGLRMDPDKVKAIKEWEAPTTVKGVRGFLGFANFYRQFILGFSELVDPLVLLTGKNAVFAWGEKQNSAFEKLKDMFAKEPILMGFRDDRVTIVETDSSGWAYGAVLSQYDDDGLLRPVAFFSRKASPAECNYDIHDKEMLAIIRALQHWDAELRSVEKFTVITDHKNLEFFMRPRKLGERHVRWSYILSRYDLTLKHRAGKENVCADALSRRDQDMPANEDDERIKSRHFQLLKPQLAVIAEEEEEHAYMGTIMVFTTNEGELDGPTIPGEPEAQPAERTELQRLWDDGVAADKSYQQIQESVRKEARKFPPELKIKASIAECEVRTDGVVFFRGRQWTPEYEPLRTRMINDIHTSPTFGHPGRRITFKKLSELYFWPGMSTDVKRYVENCDTCGRTKSWKDGKQGFLHPLPVPDRVWHEVSMDFITDLPESDGCTILMVVTDRLSKDVILIPLPNMDTDAVVHAFLRYCVAYHYFPGAITSDRGGQFVSHMWERMCQIAGIKRRLSTAFHPETDGATERMNSTVETYLKAYCNYRQTDWAKWVALAQIAIKLREAKSIEMTPFFVTHGYNPDLLQLRDSATEGRREPKMDDILSKLQATAELASATMADAQQEQEKYANRHRKEAPRYKVGDSVWLQFGKQFSTPGRPSRKLDYRAAKYDIVEIISPHAVRLNTPPGIHDVFHVDRLRLVPKNPLPSQPQPDNRPAAIQIDGQEEWVIEDIVAEKWRRRGRGAWKRWLEVKWEGYVQTTLEPEDQLAAAEALDRWEAYSRRFRREDGRLEDGFRRGHEQTPKNRGGG